MIRLSVRCRPELAERVLAELLALAPDGVEEEHARDYVEYAIYGAPGEVPSLPQLEASAGEGVVEVASTTVPDDWADRWRDFHRPSVVDGRVVVQPSWAAGASTGPGVGGEVRVVIDPGQAFGTGAHATTRMCIAMLLELADAGHARGSLADLGTGSGVLAICAAKLGWSPVLGLDHEQAAVRAAGANAESNGVAASWRRLDLRREPLPPAETVVANLTAPLLREVASRLSAAEPPQHLVASGLLLSEADDIARRLQGAGLSEVGRASEGEWAALRLERCR